MVEQVVIQSPESGPTDPNAAQQQTQQGEQQQTQQQNPTLPSEQQQQQAPAKLAGKFETPADLEKAYLELQAKLGKPGEQQQQTQQQAPKDPLKVSEDADVNAAKDAVNQAGLNFDELSTEYAKDGKLGDASYEKLEKAGIPKAMVDSFIAGQMALAQQQATVLANAAHEAAGGQDKYTEAVKWAGENLDVDAKKAFNAVIERGNPAEVKLAVAGLMSQYTSAGGAEPKNLSPAGNGGPSVYNSVAEVMKDMSDPRYQSDSAFRKAVESKVARSNVL